VGGVHFHAPFDQVSGVGRCTLVGEVEQGAAWSAHLPDSLHRRIRAAQRVRAEARAQGAVARVPAGAGLETAL
jgi:hypothetical protein